MAVTGNTVLTLSDIAKRMSPDYKMEAAVVEVLAQQNDILKVLPFMEGNLPTGHRVTIRTGLPTVGTRRINQGVTPSKSTTAQKDDATMLLEGLSEVDTEALRLSGNPGATRASEDVATLEAMNQFFATNLFYGNSAQYIDRFHGLAPRYGSLSGEYGNMILDAQGSGSDNTSLWLVGMGERGMHGIYPKGTKAGIERDDLGKQVVTDSNGRKHTVMMTKHVWHSGISIKDYRHVIRIANIDVSDLTTYGSGSDSSAKLLRLMIQAMNKVPGAPTGYGLQYAFVGNETVKTWADIMTTEGQTGTFKSVQVHGQEFTGFRGVPFLKCEALLDSESQVT